MEKSDSSDSDSNSSTSWVFVYDCAPPIRNANTFHLDCSREPIQELTEQDLLSSASDHETDTDGVSVISESEAIIAELNRKTSEGTSDLQNEDANNGELETLATYTVPLGKSLITESKNLFKCTNIVGVGVVLTAVFFGSYSLINQKNSDTDIGGSEHLTIYDSAKTDNDFLYKTDNDLEEIVDLTLACTYRDEDQNVAKHKKIKQCVKAQYEIKKLVKEATPQFVTQEHESQSQNVIQQSEDTLKVDDNNNELLFQNIDKIIEEQSREVHLISSHNKTKKHKKNFNKPLKNKDKERSFADKNGSKVEKLKRKNKDVRKAPKNKLENLKRTYQVKFKNKYDNVNVKKNNTSKYPKDGNVSGEWFSDWHKARQQLRKYDFINENRRRKKMKTQWYFKWMDGREELRYKKSYRPYSS